jgi:hypothetical protein
LGSRGRGWGFVNLRLASSERARRTPTACPTTSSPR